MREFAPIGASRTRAVFRGDISSVNLGYHSIRLLHKRPQCNIHHHPEQSNQPRHQRVSTLPTVHYLRRSWTNHVVLPLQKSLRLSQISTATFKLSVWDVHFRSMATWTPASLFCLRSNIDAAPTHIACGETPVSSNNSRDCLARLIWSSLRRNQQSYSSKPCSLFIKRFESSSSCYHALRLKVAGIFLFHFRGLHNTSSKYNEVYCNICTRRFEKANNLYIVMKMVPHNFITRKWSCLWWIIITYFTHELARRCENDQNEE